MLKGKTPDCDSKAATSTLLPNIVFTSDEGTNNTTKSLEIYREKASSIYPMMKSPTSLSPLIVPVVLLCVGVTLAQYQQEQAAIGNRRLSHHHHHHSHHSRNDNDHHHSTPRNEDDEIRSAYQSRHHDGDVGDWEHRAYEDGRDSSPHYNSRSSHHRSHALQPKEETRGIAQTSNLSQMEATTTGASTSNASATGSLVSDPKTRNKMIVVLIAVAVFILTMLHVLCTS